MGVARTPKKEYEYEVSLYILHGIPSFEKSRMMHYKMLLRAWPVWFACTPSLVTLTNWISFLQEEYWYFTSCCDEMKINLPWCMMKAQRAMKCQQVWILFPSISHMCARIEKHYLFIIMATVYQGCHGLL